MFSTEILEAIRAHGIAEYPKEACGFVFDTGYEPAENVHAEPTKSFRIHDEDVLEAESRGLRAIIHSHPDGPAHPSYSDMLHQRGSGVPWGIVKVKEGFAEQPFFFGDEAPVPPLLGRSFRHGVTDCYALIRDFYNLEKGILLPEYPRDYNWWHNGQDLYAQNFRDAGFVPISEPEPGDVFLAQIHATVSNHGGVLLPDGLILHHLVNRLSRREPLFTWRRFVTTWLRYNG